MTLQSPNVFADRLTEGVRRLGPLCVGVDPHPALIPELFGSPGPASALAWGKAVIDRCAGRVAVVKPQAALFERWGARGVLALEEVCAAAQAAGLIIILDAKRGDIGSTAEGYAEAYLGAGASCHADCLTVNPYMGLDTIEPFVAVAEARGRGVAVLVRTSNPGSADFQSLRVGDEPLYMKVARSLAPMTERLMGASGWSGLMMVAGATGPREAAEIRGVAGRALFLVPGYGAQGGGAEAALSGFAPGSGGREGGVVNASRSVSLPDAARGLSKAAEWDRIVEAAIESAQADLVRAAANEG